MFDKLLNQYEAPLVARCGSPWREAKVFFNKKRKLTRQINKLKRLKGNKAYGVKRLSLAMNDYGNLDLRAQLPDSLSDERGKYLSL